MTNADKPAYPIVPPVFEEGPAFEGSNGLTKREAFAMAAMQGIVKEYVYQDSVTGETHGHDFVAQMAIKVADELLKELENRKND